MSLEELKKIDAKNLPIGKLITMISRGHTIYLNHNLDELDINASQLHLLFEISHQNNINQEKIASRCNFNKGAVARSIKKLEDKNLVVRKIDDKNRRQNIVSLTDKGEEILKKSIEILNIWEDEIYNNINIEKELLQEVLKDIAINTIELNNKDE
ncbi:MarR family winged helix-turn-helix transcriptional regulator [uncultured Methanobrevibacter sp.]|uniref:MarR family winged helix-turn-helix transcriptional regulator n=1 Tax=uncultured Methanobrevibacter sp. TaxID=253161 RepID=UPI0025E1B929|nr:MarR family transcriptional regulator [uncultured Methanobrevibacter sp.]